MKPRIAIPVPHSQKQDYNARSLPQYEQALRAAGAEPVVVPLDLPNEEIATLIKSCTGVLLPGSPADIDPQKFSAEKHPKTNPADPGRDNVDELLLQDAYNMHKPVFGICYGLQSINVWRSGTLNQHVEGDGVDHEAGKEVAVAHKIRVNQQTLFADIVGNQEVPVNSSHHQVAEVIGDGLRVAAVSEDGLVEAIEGTNPEHYVMAVQWHPERSQDEASKRLFERFVREAAAYKPRQVAREAGS